LCSLDIVIKVVVARALLRAVVLLDSSLCYDGSLVRVTAPATYPSLLHTIGHVCADPLNNHVHIVASYAVTTAATQVTDRHIETRIVVIIVNFLISLDHLAWL